MYKNVRMDCQPHRVGFYIAAGKGEANRLSLVIFALMFCQIVINSYSLTHQFSDHKIMSSSQTGKVVPANLGKNTEQDTSNYAAWSLITLE